MPRSKHTHLHFSLTRRTKRRSVRSRCITPNVAVQAVQFSSTSPNTVAPRSRCFVCCVVWCLVYSHDRSVGIFTRLRAGRSPGARFFHFSKTFRMSLGSMHPVFNWVPAVFTQQDSGRCLKMTSHFYVFFSAWLCGVNTDRLTPMFLSYRYAGNALSQISNSSFGRSCFWRPFTPTNNLVSNFPCALFQTCFKNKLQRIRRFLRTERLLSWSRNSPAFVFGTRKFISMFTTFRHFS